MLNFFSKAARIRHHAEKQLEKHSTANIDFFVLITLAAAIASIGLLLNNVAIIIGAMLVAPLVTPIFGFSLHLLLIKLKGLGRSLLSILAGTLLSIVISTLIGYLVIFIEGKEIIINNSIISQIKPNLLYFLVALFSGMAGAFAYARPNLVSKITGIAISTAIIPPLAVIGLSIATQNWQLTELSSLLYILNLAGICFGSIIMFLILGFGKEIEKENITE